MWGAIPADVRGILICFAANVKLMFRNKRLMNRNISIFKYLFTFDSGLPPRLRSLR